jgi:hypothetical protein
MTEGGEKKGTGRRIKGSDPFVFALFLRYSEALTAHLSPSARIFTAAAWWLKSAW